MTRTRLLGWRTEFRFGALESALLALYTGVLTLTLPFHEPWADEAQAWLIARDNSLWQILRYRLHYEGHPGLWYVLLHAFQHLGGRYAAIDYFGATFAVAGIAIFLRFSPFPLLLRILLPFTFFLQYQYAVIARSYTLFPLLAFALCALFYSRARQLWFLLLAGLLANVSFQGAVYSFCLVALYLYQHLGRKPVTDRRPRLFIAPTLLYLALFAIAALSAMPAPDTGIAGGPPVTDGAMARLLTLYPGTLPQSQFLPPLPPPLHQEPPPDPPEPLPASIAPPSALAHPALRAAWFINQDPAPAPVLRPALKTTLELLTLVTAPLSTLKLLALAFVALLTEWLRRTHNLPLLLPWLANVLVGEVLWIADHHTGLLFLSLLTALWLAAPRSGEPAKTSPRLAQAVILVLAMISVLQIAWTATAIRKDIHQPYDPGPETAAWLLAHPHQHMAAFGFIATGVQPFFPANPFFNISHSYFIWAVGHNADTYHYAVLEQHPDLVLFTQDLLAEGFTHNDWAPLSADQTVTHDHDLSHNIIIQDLNHHGYAETHRFCGDRFFRFAASYRACNLIFEPTRP